MSRENRGVTRTLMDWFRLPRAISLRFWQVMIISSQGALLPGKNTPLAHPEKMAVFPDCMVWMRMSMMDDLHASGLADI